MVTQKNTSFNPLQVSYKRSILTLLYIISNLFQSLIGQLQTKSLHGIPNLIILVSIPYRLATNFFAFIVAYIAMWFQSLIGQLQTYWQHYYTLHPNCVSIPYRLATNKEPVKDKPFTKDRFNPLQVSYKRKTK